jgi:hypothetical protein
MPKVGPYRAKLEMRRRERASEELRERLEKGEAAAPPKPVEPAWSDRSAAVARAREVLLRGPVTLNEGAFAARDGVAEAVKKHLTPLGARAEDAKRVLERFDKLLATHLARVPPEDHVQISQRLGRGLTELLTKVPPYQTVAALSAYVDLLEAGLPRLSLQKITEQTDQLAATGSASLQKLASAFRGGQGLSTAFNLVPQLIELSAEPGWQSAGQQAERLEMAADWIIGSSPRSGPTPEQAGVLSDRVQHSETLQAAVAQSAKLREPQLPFPDVKGVPAHAQAAVVALRAVSVADPANTALNARLPDFVSRLEALGQLPAGDQAWNQFAGLIKKAEGQPGSEMILDAILARGEVALAHPEILKQAQDHGIPGLLALKLGQEGGEISPELKAALADLDGLPEGPRLIAALAQHAAPVASQAALAFGLYQLTAERGAGSDAELAQYIEHFDQALAVVGQFATPRQMGALAHALAVNVPADQFTPDNLKQLDGWAKRLHANVPQLQVDQLIASQGRRGGLLSLAGNKPEMLEKMGPFVGSLAQVVAKTPAAADPDVHRLALNVAMELGRIDGSVDMYNRFVAPDLSKALTTPASIHVPVGSHAKTLGELYLQHPEFPPELLATAATHLSVDQMTWLSSTLKLTRSKIAVRGFRDAVFAGLTLGHPEFVEALRTGSSPDAAKSAATWVGLEYRQGRGAAIPWEQLEAGLAAGKDVSGEIKNARATEAIKQLELEPPPGTKIAPEAVDELARVQVLVGQMANFFAAPGAPPGAAKVFKESLEAMLGGEQSWQAKKYGDEIAVRQLAGLSPESVEVWKKSAVSVPNAPANPELGANPSFQLAKAQLEKLRMMLAGVKIRSAAGIELTLESVAALHLERDEAVARLRASAKGSVEFRELSAKLGALQDPLAVLELRQALETFSHATPAQLPVALAAVKNALHGTRGGLGVLGGSAFQRFAKETEYAVSEIKATASIQVRPEVGLYVDDSDTLESYLNSFGSGSCINPIYGANRVGLIPFIADAQYRMARIFVDNRQVGRGVLRLLDFTIGGKTQKVLWVDAAVDPNAQQIQDPAQLGLYLRHALAKARAMGVPLFSPSPQIAKIAEEQGLQTTQPQAKVSIDMGHYPAHHSQALTASQNGRSLYFAAMPKRTRYAGNVEEGATSFTAQNSGYFVETRRE